MTERQLTAKVLKWARENIPHSCAIEVKLARGKSISFHVLAEHQEHALMLATGDGMCFKIPDGGWQNPFDGFVLKNEIAYVAVIFSPRIYYIPIWRWNEERSTSSRKSLTEDRAKKISGYCA